MFEDEVDNNNGNKLKQVTFVFCRICFDYWGLKVVLALLLLLKLNACGTLKLVKL